ncbi:MAG: Gfo/Idh/MocA family oxidoreductase [Deltaproteobacteria bacterium]|nr:Gfo/Idh/MocA family oxidoreductase [Deltaproteobacteria bacterium]
MTVMRVGIIGCGTVSEIHISHLRRIDGIEIAGVCDPDRDRAQRVADRFQIRHVYQSASNMLADRRPKVVHILTPPRSHKALSVQAMEAGCHVLVEKPMAVSVEEADAMIAASRSSKVTLGVCHNNLFEPAVMEAAELVASGAIGNVITVETFWRLWRAGSPDRFHTTEWIYELPGGIFHEVAPHSVYLHRQFLNTLQVVSAFSKKTGSDLPSPSDELRVLFEGESGLGSLSVSISAKPYLRFLKIYGTEMTIHVDLNNNTSVNLRRDGIEKFSKALVNVDQIVQLFSKTIGNTVKTLLGRRRVGHEVLIGKFYKSLFEGTKPPVTGEDGREVVGLLERIWSELDRTSPMWRQR